MWNEYSNCGHLTEKEGFYYGTCTKEPLLVYTDAGSYMILDHDIYKGWLLLNGYQVKKSVKVTHWMELPSKPSEDLN